MLLSSRSRVQRAAFALVFCSLAGLPAVADESITVLDVSGNLEPGGALIVTGRGFGQKSPAAPMVYDDFEGHTSGAPIGNPVHGTFTRVGQSVYTDSDSYTGGGASFSPIRETSGASPGLVSNWIPLEAEAAFASMKFKVVSMYGSLAPHNIKLLRLNGHDPDPTHGYPNYNIGSERGYESFYGIVNHGLTGQVYAGGFRDLENPMGWNSLSIWETMGDPDVPNGMVGREINGQVEERTGIVTRPADEFAGPRSAYFCGYVSRSGYDVDVYLDDVYADVTLARVLVRDPGGGNHEMQIPQAWSDSRIEVAANPGRYPSGTELELVVYDADNNASAPITVIVGDNQGGGGSTGSDDPPGAPTAPILELVQ